MMQQTKQGVEMKCKYVELWSQTASSQQTINSPSVGKHLEKLSPNCCLTFHTSGEVKKYTYGVYKCRNVNELIYVIHKPHTGVIFYLI